MSEFGVALTVKRKDGMLVTGKEARALVKEMKAVVKQLKRTGSDGSRCTAPTHTAGPRRTARAYSS